MCVPAAPTNLKSLSQELISSAPIKPTIKKRRYPHIVVQHNYHDHANDPMPAGFVLDNNNNNNNNNNHSSNIPFPIKLHRMLEGVIQEGLEDIVSWQPHGRCFVVHKTEEFKGLLPRYFKLSKIASFQRQLNLYGFQRITKGADRGGYYNELFLRARPWLSNEIQRVKVKGTGVRARSNPEEEPNFWEMPFVDTENVPAQTVSESGMSVVSDDSEDIQQDTDDLVLSGWGMPFHYMPHTEVAPASEPFDGLDLDLDIFDQYDAENDKDFVDLLEMIVS